MVDYDLHCSDPESSHQIHKQRHQCRQTGMVFLVWKNAAVISQLGRFYSSHLSVFIPNMTSNMQPQTNTQNSKICQNFKLGRRRRSRENVAFIVAQCTNECLMLIPLRFLETILSHVEILFGAICHGKRDRIYYLLHSIIARPGVLLRWERSENALF